MVSRKYFMICMLLTLLRNTASLNFVDYLNNAINITTSLPTHISSTSDMTATSTSPITKCDIQMNNGDPNSVREDLCECADGYAIIDHDEYDNKIPLTCVEILPETSTITETEDIKTTATSSKLKPIRKKETFRATGSLLGYYITGGALFTLMITVSGRFN